MKGGTVKGGTVKGGTVKGGTVTAGTVKGGEKDQNWTHLVEGPEWDPVERSNQN